MSKKFSGTVWCSYAILGPPESNPEISGILVSYIQRNGAKVLNQYIADSRKRMQFISELAKSNGYTAKEWFDLERKIKSGIIYQHDIEGVKQADRLVVLPKCSSSGVGMEVQYALNKPAMGMNLTPILVLVEESLLPELPTMIQGAAEQTQHMFVTSYTTLLSAYQAIDNFFTFTE